MAPGSIAQVRVLYGDSNPTSSCLASPQHTQKTATLFETQPHCSAPKFCLCKELVPPEPTKVYYLFLFVCFLESHRGPLESSSNHPWKYKGVNFLWIIDVKGPPQAPLKLCINDGWGSLDNNWNTSKCFTQILLPPTHAKLYQVTNWSHS